MPKTGPLLGYDAAGGTMPPKKMLPVVVAITGKPVKLGRSVNSLSISRHGESSSELGSVMI
jgi:hypothetical protein